MDTLKKDDMLWYLNFDIIRAYLLEPGDVFVSRQTYFRVCYIQEGKIYYCYYYLKDSALKNRLHTMGAKSRERLILITNKTKQNEHHN